MKKAKRNQPKHQMTSAEEALEPTRTTVDERFEGIPEIRWDKVNAFRKQLASQEWKPESGKVAEKILFEHLLEPASY